MSQADPQPETELEAYQRIQLAVATYNRRLGARLCDYPATVITRHVPTPGFLIATYGADELLKMITLMGDDVDGVPVYYQPITYLRLSAVPMPPIPPQPPRTRTVEL